MKKNCILPILIITATFYLSSNFLHGAPQTKIITKRDVKSVLKDNSDFFKKGKLQTKNPYFIAKRASNEKKNLRTSPFKKAKEYLKNGKLRTEKPYIIVKRAGKRNKKTGSSLLRVVKNYQKSGKRQAAKLHKKGRGGSLK